MSNTEKEFEAEMEHANGSEKQGWFRSKLSGAKTALKENPKKIVKIVGGSALVLAAIGLIGYAGLNHETVKDAGDGETGKSLLDVLKQVPDAVEGTEEPEANEADPEETEQA